MASIVDRLAASWPADPRPVPRNAPKIVFASNWATLSGPLLFPGPALCIAGSACDGLSLAHSVHLIAELFLHVNALDRREFLHARGRWHCLGLGVTGSKGTAAAADDEPLFKISLAQWSLHKTLFGKKLDNLDFAKTAKNDYGIDAVEYVNQFFKDKAKDEKYLAELKKRADDQGVKSVLIMCDGEGDLGDPDEAKRTKAVENHYPWVEAAKFLGCHSIRVNADSKGTPEEQRKLAADGLRRLSEFGATLGMNVIVENHGGLSSNGDWLAGVMKAVGSAQLRHAARLRQFRSDSTTATRASTS